MAVVVIGFVASAGWCLVALGLGPRLGFVDRPSDDSQLKIHRRPAVPLGGVGLYLAVFAASWFRDELDWALLAAATLVLILGLVDERIGLTPRLRLVVEAVVALIIVFGWDLAETGVATAVLAGGLIVAAINAVNLFDGLDGLAASTGLASAAGLAIAAGLMSLAPTVGLALAAGLVGFLIFNWHPARVFLGDGGSYLLGLLLATEIIRLSPDGGLQLVATSALLGLFVVDLFITLARRRKHDRPLFEGDRSHVYDQLRDRGRSIPQIALASLAVQTVLVGVVIAARELLSPPVAVFTAWAMMLALTGLLVARGFLRVDHSDR